MSILQKRLKELLQKEMLIVMEDGRGFKGKLVEYDDEYIVLKDVIESSTVELRWRVPLVALPPSEKGTDLDKEGLTIGDTGSKLVKLREVMIRIPMILRIWTWTPEKVKEEDFDVEKY